ncbi:MAG: branched-chain amino acid transport system II carrier protein [Bacteroidota bacterium]
MNRRKEIFVVAFALFSLFFGAGNLILPPHLGFMAGDTWIWVTLGFAISAVIIPILGILAHARLQGTLFDIAKKVSPTFSLVYCYLIYAVSISLPSPRTASVAHEMAILPLFESASWLTSSIYFFLVFLFVVNRSRILNLIGKFLTPGILLILLTIIGITLTGFEFSFSASEFTNPFSRAILEGYQTFDAIGAVVVGGVIIISVNLKHKELDFEAKRGLIGTAGIYAGLGLFLVYAGLILTGALMQGEFDNAISRTELLNGISLKTLGSSARLFLSLLVSLACFTTAVGIVTGTADFVKGRFNESRRAYVIAAIIGCVLGVVMGQFNVAYIIAVALPTLMFMYPITIVLILLNLLPEKWASKNVFHWIVAVTILFSIPDFLASVGQEAFSTEFSKWIPLSEFHMGWVMPALIVFIITSVISKEQSD